jgi:hypothetical protein
LVLVGLLLYEIRGGLHEAPYLVRDETVDDGGLSHPLGYGTAGCGRAIGGSHTTGAAEQENGSQKYRNERA